jgi:hypothetical protein
LKIPITKRAGGVAQGEGPEFKPQYCKNKQTNKQKQKGSEREAILRPVFIEEIQAEKISFKNAKLVLVLACNPRAWEVHRKILSSRPA